MGGRPVEYITSWISSSPHPSRKPHRSSRRGSSDHDEHSKKSRDGVRKSRRLNFKTTLENVLTKLFSDPSYADGLELNSMPKFLNSLYRVSCGSTNTLVYLPTPKGSPKCTYTLVPEGCEILTRGPQSIGTNPDDEDKLQVDITDQRVTSVSAITSFAMHDYSPYTPPYFLQADANSADAEESYSTGVKGGDGVAPHNVMSALSLANQEARMRYGSPMSVASAVPPPVDVGRYMTSWERVQGVPELRESSSYPKPPRLSVRTKEPPPDAGTARVRTSNPPMHRPPTVDPAPEYPGRVSVDADGASGYAAAHREAKRSAGDPRGKVLVFDSEDSDQ
ncbi:hypothetical protein GGR52DRAFT_566766 [Hypoxylon sp. FL1284]|nr:hypothetical protein GGR52DRAFT_566766 [Hypoxylon sp. FL1284]